MPRFSIDDDAHSHPKIAMAGDAAFGMWSRAGTFCTGYGTDGFVPDWWVKQQPQGAAKAKKLIAAQLWHRGEYEGDRPEYQGQKGYNFHEWRQDSYAKVEADREKARLRKEAERQRKAGVTPNVTRDGDRDSGCDSARTHLVIPTTQENSQTYVESASPDPAAREPRSAPVRPDAWRLIREIIPDEHPQAVRTELAIQASALLKADHPENDVADAVRLWTTKNVHPKVLPSLLSELINTRNRPQDTAAGSTQRAPHKLRATHDFAAELRAQEQTQLADSPRKELE